MWTIRRKEDTKICFTIRMISHKNFRQDHQHNLVTYKIPTTVGPTEMGIIITLLRVTTCIRCRHTLMGTSSTGIMANQSKVIPITIKVSLDREANRYLKQIFFPPQIINISNSSIPTEQACWTILMASKTKMFSVSSTCNIRWISKVSNNKCLWVIMDIIKVGREVSSVVNNLVIHSNSKEEADFLILNFVMATNNNNLIKKGLQCQLHMTECNHNNNNTETCKETCSQDIHHKLIVFPVEHLRWNSKKHRPFFQYLKKILGHIIGATTKVIPMLHSHYNNLTIHSYQHTVM